MITPPPGCAFHPRCYLREGRSICRTEIPEQSGSAPPSTCRRATSPRARRSSRSLRSRKACRRDRAPQAQAAETTRELERLVRRQHPRGQGPREALPDQARLLKRTDRRGAGRRRRRPHRQAAARRSASSASPAAESRRSAARSSGCSTRPTADRLPRDTTSRACRGGELRPVRRDMQMVFQDPYASLNPRMTVRRHRQRAAARPPQLRGRAAKLRVERSCCEVVGLSPEHGNRYPHEFSGGQRQRIGIARALALEPEAHRRSTSRSPRSTSRSRRRSSTCSPTSSGSSSSPTSSSRTTSPSSATSPTASR